MNEARQLSELIFDRGEGAEIIGVPYTTLQTWRALGIHPNNPEDCRRGVPVSYSGFTLLHGGIAKRAIESGHSQKAIRVVLPQIPGLLSESGALTGKPSEMGGIIVSGDRVKFLPRPQWDDREQFAEAIADCKASFWTLDLQPIFADIIRGFIRVIEARWMARFGFAIGPQTPNGKMSLKFADGTVFEGDSIEDLLKKSSGKRVTMALNRAARFRGLDAEQLADMEDAARFIGYADAEEFSRDIETVRRGLQPEVMTVK